MTSPKYTYEDYICIPDTGKRYQLIEGELYMVPAPIPYHQIVSIRIASNLSDYIETNDLGMLLYAPCDIVLSEEDVVQPDIFFISRDRLNIITDKNINGAPDLVVEILSPSTSKIDRNLKKKLYLRHEVKEYWIVYPDEEIIEVLIIEGQEYKRSGLFMKEDALVSPLLQGLKIDLKDIF
ncbi:MAG: Uma2 family endonuclease [Nitrospirota bacterium]